MACFMTYPVQTPTDFLISAFCHDYNNHNVLVLATTSSSGIPFEKNLGHSGHSVAYYRRDLHNFRPDLACPRVSVSHFMRYLARINELFIALLLSFVYYFGMGTAKLLDIVSRLWKPAQSGTSWSEEHNPTASAQAYHSTY